MSQKYKTIDLCAGIGGIRKGFEMTGQFENVLSAEIDENACRTYEHLFDENPQNDLTSEDFKEKVSQVEYDVLLAGFPCQPFSSAGEKLGFRDKTRGTIFFEIADIISRTYPKAIFLENVENLVSHDSGKTLKTIITTLEEELDYRIIGVSLDEDGSFLFSAKSFVRNSKHFGVPQNRARVYIMAFNKKIYGDAVKLLTMTLPVDSEKTVFADVNDILDDDVDIRYYMSSGYLETLKKHKVREKAKGHGFGYCVVNNRGTEHPIANTILATGGSGKERNLIYQPKDGVAGVKLPTKQTELNNEGIRVMTPNEWGRLQGFVGYAFMENGKDEFSFPDNMTDGQKYKQFGNSVAIPVIESMADFMLRCFDIMNQDQEKAVIQTGFYKERFTKRDVIERLRINKNQAGYLLKGLVNDKTISIVKHGRYSEYELTAQAKQKYSLYRKIENGND